MFSWHYYTYLNFSTPATCFGCKNIFRRFTVSFYSVNSVTFWESKLILRYNCLQCWRPTTTNYSVWMKSDWTKNITERYRRRWENNSDSAATGHWQWLYTDGRAIRSMRHPELSSRDSLSCTLSIMTLHVSHTVRLFAARPVISAMVNRIPSSDGSWQSPQQLLVTQIQSTPSHSFL
jgi:hypothetical protein